MLQTTERLPTDGEFAQSCTISALWPSRATSGTLDLERALRGDKLLRFSLRREKSLLGAIALAGACGFFVGQIQLYGGIFRHVVPLNAQVFAELKLIDHLSCGAFALFGVGFVGQ